MIILYHAGGASDFELRESHMRAPEARTLLANVGRVLRSRNELSAAQELVDTPFDLVDAENEFGDQFTVLWAILPLAGYERLRTQADRGTARATFRTIASTITELGPYIRFIAVDLDFEPVSDPSDGDRTRSLTELEIRSLVHRYIGVSQGYLGDFSYRSHLEFYIDLELSIDPNEYPGTTRARFERILGEQPPTVQARILEGILARFPVGSHELRTPERAAKVQSWIARLRAPIGVSVPTPRITTAVVERALLDAEHLIAASGPSSGVDRVHTAFHGYLQAVCQERAISFDEGATIATLLSRIREHHPAFTSVGPRSEDIRRVLRSMGAIADSLNPLRNQASVAHPNPALLDAPEAMLVINTVRTLLHYLDHRVSG